MFTLTQPRRRSASSSTITREHRLPTDTRYPILILFLKPVKNTLLCGLACALLSAMAASAQKPSVWKHITRPDWGIDVHLYSIADSDTTPKNDVDRRADRVHIASSLGLNLPFIEALPSGRYPFRWRPAVTGSADGASVVMRAGLSARPGATLQSARHVSARRRAMRRGTGACRPARNPPPCGRGSCRCGRDRIPRCGYGRCPARSPRVRRAR